MHEEADANHRTGEDGPEAADRGAPVLCPEGRRLAVEAAGHPDEVGSDPEVGRDGVAAPSVTDGPVYLYVFGKLGGPFKVGYSNNPKIRAVDIRKTAYEVLVDDTAVMWVQIRVMGLPTAKAVEKESHRILVRHKITLHERHHKSEWFNVTLKAAHSAIRKACKTLGVEAIEYKGSADDKFDKKTLMQVWLLPEHVLEIDELRRCQPDLPTRPEMLRRLITITHSRSPRRA